MDPLSIAASVASLLALISQVIETCDTLYMTVKKRPKMLKALSEDLKSLTRVLSDLEKVDARKATGEEDALKECVDGCGDVLKELQTEFHALQGHSEGNVMLKTYAQITFKSKMDSILETRAQVERYTHTLGLALLLRQHASSTVIVAQLSQIHGELSQARLKANRPTKLLNPMQQYVDASANMFPMASSTSTSLSERESSSTLVDGDALQDIIASAKPPAASNAVTSYGTFTEWLESFAQPDAGPGHPQTQQTAYRVTATTSSARREGSSDSPPPVEIIVTGLPLGVGANSQTIAETLHLEHSDFWEQAMILLRQKGYRRICGFRFGDIFLHPMRAHSADVRVTVTQEPSIYSMAKGLKINVNQPLQLYLDNFVRVGETGSSISPLSMKYSSKAGKVMLVDYPGNQPCKHLEITFNRTLRVPENGTVYNPPALFSPFPLINLDDIKSNFLPEVRRKGGFLVPLFQREALALSFEGENSRHISGLANDGFAIRIYTGSVNVVTGKTNEQPETGVQDYVVVPGQNTLDGYLVRAGAVRQFDSMPLGSGYTVESQVTGKEALGGLQMLIAPCFRGRGTFAGHPNQRLTPQQIGLSLDDHLLMSGLAVETRAESFRLADTGTFPIDDSTLFHRFTQRRPVFVHEILSQLTASGMCTGPLCVQPVLPYELDIRVRQPKEYVPIRYHPGENRYLRPKSCGFVRLPRHYSPFLALGEFLKVAAELLKVTEVAMLFSDGRELERRTNHVALYEVMDDGIVLNCQAYTMDYMDGMGLYSMYDTADMASLDISEEQAQPMNSFSGRWASYLVARSSKSLYRTLIRLNGTGKELVSSIYRS
jgi:hypothetical protein